MKAALNDFVYTGILASYCVRDLQSKGLLRSPVATVEERQDQDLFAPVSEKIRGSSIQMQRWYRMLFAFENVLRDFMVARFTETDGEEWFEKRASNVMKKKLEDRKAREKKAQWHVGRNQEPIYYLDFGDLGNLITTHFDVFKDFFEQTWILSRIEDAEKTRNLIAHTNVLPAEEGARLEMYLRDLLRQLGG